MQNIPGTLPRSSSSCFHGGAFFGAIGERFDDLSRRKSIINADVLDAWFPPAPAVAEALEEHMNWLLRTSPPTGCEGLIEAIADARGVMPQNVLPGAGSSDLIFLALREWLTPSSRVLLLDPTYGEYAHVLDKVIGCHTDRLVLSRDNDYDVRLSELQGELSHGYDLVILVNPNSPTGRSIHKNDLQNLLRYLSPKTKLWIDETYIDYVGENESLESIATTTSNVVVCKSMSKVYALSGARAAYLCGASALIEPLRLITPPWAVGLLGQVAAVKALENPDYYGERYKQTHTFRAELSEALAALGLSVVPGCANFVLCHMPQHLPSASIVVERCRKHQLFLRDAAKMGTCLGTHALRIAVKDPATNAKIVEIIRQEMTPSFVPGTSCVSATADRMVA